MKKIIIAIVGRSGSGKDTLIHAASETYSIPIVSSYTDRPMRPNEHNGVEHIFLSKEQMDKIVANKSNLLAYTQIGKTGYRYCVTKSNVNSLPGDMVFYTLDPNGVKYLKEHCPEYEIRVVSVQADYHIRKLRAITRNGEESAFLKRTKDENAQFDIFEHNENNYEFLVKNNTTLQEAVSEFLTILESIICENEKETIR